MKQSFTKKDLLSGDIIVERNGDRGVVILETDCIIYEKGGFDPLDIFTEDLFIDGSLRCGDIFRVCRGFDGPIGFRQLDDGITVFRRINNKKTKERAKELDEKYDMTKGKNLVLILEPFSRHFTRAYVDFQRDMAPDLALSEAPSMTACGQIEKDRTYIPVPNAKNLFLIYNRFQEERHLAIDEENRRCGHLRDGDPVVIIPEDNIQIHSRCMLVRMTPDGKTDDLQEEDLEKASAYFYRMELSEQRKKIVI